MTQSLKKAFISGTLVLLPLGLTIWLLQVLLDYAGLALGDILFALDSLGRPISLWLFKKTDPAIRESLWIDYTLSLLALIYLGLVTVLIGYCAQWLLGRLLINQTKKFLNSYPTLKSIFKTIHELGQAFNPDNNNFLKESIALQATTSRSYQLAFTTAQTRNEIASKLSSEHVCIFIPTTPNPTSGMLVFVDKKALLPLNLNCNETLKTIISAGIYQHPSTTKNPSC